MARRLGSGAKEFWRVGFSLDALEGIKFMSGLVEVEEVLYTGGAVFFFLRSTDRTRTIFRTGFLQGTPIDALPARTGQSLLVSANAPGPSLGVGHVC